MLSDNNGIKVEINMSKIAGKLKKMWRINNMFLNKTWIKAEVSKEI